MRILLGLMGLLSLAALLAASPVTEPAPRFAPDARLVYESDARAYYRPCG